METGEAGHFEIRVQCHVDDETWECLKELAKKNGLGVKLTDHTLVIYASADEKLSQGLAFSQDYRGSWTGDFREKRAR